MGFSPERTDEFFNGSPGRDLSGLEWCGLTSTETLQNGSHAAKPSESKRKIPECAAADGFSSVVAKYFSEAKGPANGP
ncbi:hypothetical protein AOLI_G00191910 [Acnodon oligacanthus]